MAAWFECPLVANGILGEASEIRSAGREATFEAGSPFENDRDLCCPGALQHRQQQ